MKCTSKSLFENLEFIIPPGHVPLIAVESSLLYAPRSLPLMHSSSSKMSHPGSRVGSASQKPGSGEGKRDNVQMLNHLRSMQQMEKDTQETLSKFMNVLNTHQQTDYAGLLEEKIQELQAADTEIKQLRSEINEYELRIKDMTLNEEKVIAEKGKIIEEKIRAGKAAAQADQIIKNLQNQMKSMEVKHKDEMETKGNILKNVEEELIKSKTLSEEAYSKLHSMELETAELHSAMSSLHAEIAAQQREIEDGKEKEQRYIRQKKEASVRMDEKDTELSRVRTERRNAECRVTDLEKQLADANMSSSRKDEEGKTQMEQIARERDGVQGSLAKLSHKLKQQSETSKELNQALGRMRVELSNANETVVQERSKCQALEREIDSLRIVTKSLEQNKVESTLLGQKTLNEKENLAKDLTAANERITSLNAEHQKLTSKVESLERQRTELTVDLSCRVKDHEVVKKKLESNIIELEEAQAAFLKEKTAKEKALERAGHLEAESERMRYDLRENTENEESLARQLRESERMREQAIESSRTQQRENANRIIEYSQKNAKLSSELSSKEDELQALRRTREENSNIVNQSIKDRDEIKNQLLSTKVRLQAVEDQYEEAQARYESSKSEVEEVRGQLKSEIISREKAIAMLNEKHDEAITTLMEQLEKETEDKCIIAEAARKSAEEKMSRMLATEKEKFNQQLGESNVKREEEAEIQKGRLATLAKAMEGLQAELREESKKNATLSQELNVLKDLSEVGNTEMQEKVSYIERERTRERSRLEGQLSDAKEQLRQMVEQRQQRDQLMLTTEQQLNREREARFTALQKLRTAEDEANSMSSQVDGLTEELNAAKKEVKAHERKLLLAVQSKDAELARLTRRNEVLGEAVTRLTSSGGSDDGKLLYVMSELVKTQSPVADNNPRDGDSISPSDASQPVRASTVPDMSNTHKSSDGFSHNDGDLLNPFIDDSRMQSNDEEDCMERASTAPLSTTNSVASQKSKLFFTPTSDSLMLNSETQEMASLFATDGDDGKHDGDCDDGSSLFDIASLHSSSLTQDKHIGMISPNESICPITPEQDKNQNIAPNSDGSDASKSSGMSLPDKIRTDVELSKTRELPFSPKKRGKQTLAEMNSNVQRDTSTNSNVKARAKDRLSRAKKFLDSRKAKENV